MLRWENPTKNNMADRSTLLAKAIGYVRLQRCRLWSKLHALAADLMQEEEGVPRLLGRSGYDARYELAGCLGP